MLVLLAAGQVDRRPPPGCGANSVVEGPPVVVPGEDVRVEAGQLAQVLDDDGVQLHPVVALALVVLAPRDGVPASRSRSSRRRPSMSPMRQPVM